MKSTLPLFDFASIYQPSLSTRPAYVGSEACGGLHRTFRLVLRNVKDLLLRSELVEWHIHLNLVFGRRPFRDQVNSR